MNLELHEESAGPDEAGIGSQESLSADSVDSRLVPVILHTRVVAGAGGGPDKTILNSPRFLIPRGYRAVCAYMHPPGDPGFDALRKKAEKWQATLIGVDDRGLRDLSVIRRMLAVCRKHNVAIWHGHDYKSNALGLLLRRWWPMRLVTTVHGWVHFTRRTAWYYKLDRWLLRRYEKVICVSHDLVDECRKGGVADDRLCLIENAIDTREFRRRISRQEAKRLWNLSIDRILIGAIGRLSDEKGFDRLIQAVANLVASGHDLELVIAGEGAERPRLESQIQQAGLADRVRLLGYCPNVEELYQALDVYALSSLREGLPNVLLEAMACEVPLVATRIAGVPRLVEHETNGLLVEPGDTPSLQQALARLVSDADLRGRLAAEARATIEARYSFDVRMDKIRAVYDAVLGRRVSPAPGLR